MLRKPPARVWCSPPPSRPGSAMSPSIPVRPPRNSRKRSEVRSRKIACSGGTPRRGVRVAELALVGVDVVDPMLPVDRWHLEHRLVGDVGAQEVVDGDVRERRCHAVALPEFGESPFQVVEVDARSRLDSRSRTLLVRTHDGHGCPLLRSAVVSADGRSLEPGEPRPLGSKVPSPARRGGRSPRVAGRRCRVGFDRRPGRDSAEIRGIGVPIGVPHARPRPGCLRGDSIRPSGAPATWS